MRRAKPEWLNNPNIATSIRKLENQCKRSTTRRGSVRILREQNEKLPTMEVKYQKRAAAAVKCYTKISVGRCQPNVPLDLSDVLCEKMVILCMKCELADVWFIEASTTLLSYQKKYQWETRRAAANLEKMVWVVGSGSCSSMETSVTRTPCFKNVGGAETVAWEPRFGNGKALVFNNSKELCRWSWAYRKRSRILRWWWSGGEPRTLVFRREHQ